MKHILTGFMVAIGWKSGIFVFDTAVSTIYRLLPSKFKNKSRLGYKDFYTGY